MIYLDYNATTPLDERVLASMMPSMTDRFWNAASSHAGGRAASDAVEHAREKVADFVGARPSEITWTSGATEANNLALKGALDSQSLRRKRLVTVATEHRAVLDVAMWLQERGTEVTVLPARPDGTVDLDQLAAEVKKGDVALVSIMAANNETGVLADVREVSRLAHDHGALLHTDATQIIGKLPFDVKDQGVDLASLSGHKIYGPKGIGALFVARRIRLAPILHGGGHERGLRSGTTNVAGVVGLGTAAQVAQEVLEDEAERQRSLVQYLEDALAQHVGGMTVIAAGADRLPNTTMIRFRAADSEAVMVNAPDVLVSSGSACTALTPSPSHVLLAMGLDSTAAAECLRFSVGRPTSVEQIDKAVSDLGVAIARVRAMSR